METVDDISENVSSKHNKGRRRYCREPWLKIKWIKVEKDEPDAFFVKHELSDDIPFIRIPVAGIRRSRRSFASAAPVSLAGYDVPLLYTGPLTINKKKLDDLMSLVNIAGQYHRCITHSIAV